MCGAPPALLCCVQGVMERSTGCSIGDDARTSLKMEYKTRNPVLQTDWNGKLLPTQITAFSPAALCSYEHS